MHWVSGEQDFINGVVSDGDWAPNDQIGRLEWVMGILPE